MIKCVSTYEHVFLAALRMGLIKYVCVNENIFLAALKMGTIKCVRMNEHVFLIPTWKRFNILQTTLSINTHTGSIVLR